jgi:hypothetical protein
MKCNQKTRELFSKEKAMSLRLLPNGFLITPVFVIYLAVINLQNNLGKRLEKGVNTWHYLSYNIYRENK